MENYWRVQEVAATLKISVQTIYRYVANREIPFHKLNRAVRFKPSEIESWIESKAAGVTAARKEDPDETEVEREDAEKIWLDKHPPIKSKSNKEREKLAARIRTQARLINGNPSVVL